MLPKNIVVCADGTGNKGGYSPDSNVYKVYRMVSKRYTGVCNDGVEINEQILFYENGVGTQSNKYWRSVSGAFGLGFRRNVCDLYKFLARNYIEGDRIFLFGFSRGASTIRACNGMIAKVGLVRGHDLRNHELEKLVKEAYKAYERHRKNPGHADSIKNDKEKSHGAVPIQFLGVWDTVVALGFPTRTDITGPLTLLMSIVFGSLENVFDLLFPHSFYHYKLTDNVRHACQALAIDDERTAFWPHVWREKNIPGAQDRTPDNVEQVWFAGMHSNVGGGYPRAGMAYVPLYWMMMRAQHHGLVFNEGAMEEACDTSHINGRMYDSRAGLAAFYRYHPRNITSLCDKRLLGNIKIHCSVLARVNRRTANYVPGQIPAGFDVVDNEIPANVVHHNPGSVAGWDDARRRIGRLVWIRKRLYGTMLASILAVVGYAVYLWNNPPVGLRKEFSNSLAKAIDYFTLDMFDGLIYVVVVDKPIILVVASILLLLYFVVNNRLKTWSITAGEDLRHCIIEASGTN
jgi:uncharacterized protein (DUF2235 family)